MAARAILVRGAASRSRRRRCTLPLPALALLAIAGCGATRQPPPRHVVDASSAAFAAGARAIVLDVDLLEVPLARVLDAIAREHGVVVAADPELAGARITLRADAMRLDQTLALCATTAGGHLRLEDGHARIAATAGDPPTWSHPVSGLTRGSASGRAAALAALPALVRACCDPARWQEPRTGIRIAGDELLVRHDARMQDTVRRLLDQLRTDGRADPVPPWERTLRAAWRRAVSAEPIDEEDAGAFCARLADACGFTCTILADCSRQAQAFSGTIGDLIDATAAAADAEAAWTEGGVCIVPRGAAADPALRV